MAELPLGFGSVMIGGVIGVAGITGSSIHSVIQGKPDKANITKKVESNVGTSESATVPSAKGKFKQALEQTIKEIGKPYVYGGDEPNGFDCSGLVQFVYNKAGVHLPRTAQEQYNATKRVNEKSLIPGILLFFSETGSTSNITHVGIYAGEGKMIDAPHTGADVRVEKINTKIGSSYGADKLVGYGEP